MKEKGKRKGKEKEKRKPHYVHFPICSFLIGFRYNIRNQFRALYEPTTHSMPAKQVAGRQPLIASGCSFLGQQCAPGQPPQIRYREFPPPVRCTPISYFEGGAGSQPGRLAGSRAGSQAGQPASQAGRQAGRQPDRQPADIGCW